MTKPVLSASIFCLAKCAHYLFAYNEHCTSLENLNPKPLLPAKEKTSTTLGMISLLRPRISQDYLKSGNKRRRGRCHRRSTPPHLSFDHYRLPPNLAFLCSGNGIGRQKHPRLLERTRHGEQEWTWRIDRESGHRSPW